MGRDEAGVRLLVVGGCRVYLAHRPIIETSGESQRPTETNRSPLPALQDKRFPSTAALPHSYSPLFFLSTLRFFLRLSVVFLPSPSPNHIPASAARHKKKINIEKVSVCICLLRGRVGGGGGGVRWPYSRIFASCTASVSLLQHQQQLGAPDRDAKSTNANPRLFSASLVFCCGFTRSWSS